MGLESPLNAAVYEGHLEAVRLMLERGAATDWETLDDALFSAEHNDSERRDEMVALLTEAGASTERLKAQREKLRNQGSTE